MPRWPNSSDRIEQSPYRQANTSVGQNGGATAAMTSPAARSIPSSAPSDPAATTLDLPASTGLARLVMRRAAWVGLVTLLLVALLGLRRASDNIVDEVDAAMGLAEVVARLGSLGQTDDRDALDQLRALQVRAPLRHLELRVHDSNSRLLLAPTRAAPAAAPLELVYRLHRQLAHDVDRRLVTWQVDRPGGRTWTVSLSASHESERREALDDLLGMLALLGLGIAALLLIMQANVRHALRPLTALLQAIRGIEATDQRAVDAVRSLPGMPMRELDVIAAALRHLALALDDASEQRRQLSQKVLSLQEDERAHLARELHDEFGQRLTALRLDAAWLQRQLAEPTTATAPDAPRATRQQLASVVDDMAARCAEVQADIRDLLTRLRPLGPGSGQGDVTWQDMIDQLEGLVEGWRGTASRATPSDQTDVTLHCDLPDGAPSHLPRQLALTVYRLSQEALTNIARHAHARRAVLTLRWQPDRHAAPTAQQDSNQSGTLHWRIEDDGTGIDDPVRAMSRGNGLGGMQERVWALGGQWHMGRPRPHGTTSDRPGLMLSAGLPVAMKASHDPD
jgi:two-component system sensor histidine kinase UhpB